MQLDKLTEDEKKKLKDYINSLKEIKKEINKLMEKAGVNTVVDEAGGNRSTGLFLNV